ncbi:unnamed protein product, partial [Mesorhabditis belari]|uniref:Uncharacterized protein n=1 Tax=Mesorhabditis belari TaxID=2138241 RepID=A0AAF3FLG3_9BILA
MKKNPTEDILNKMGYAFSKFSGEATTELNDEGTSTPKGKCRVLDIDPRSPNVGISRTPITVNCTPKAGTDENSQGTPTNKAKTMQQQLFMKKKPDLLFSESDFQNSDNCEASKDK